MNNWTALPDDESKDQFLSASQDPFITVQKWWNRTHGIVLNNGH